MLMGVVLAGTLGVVSGCDGGRREVVLYTSVDEPVALEVVKVFELRTGIKVTLVTDGEATKTAGLAEKLLAEAGRPRADVYWGNEPFHTIRLARAGVFRAQPQSRASELPAMFRDAGGLWIGAGYRARMIVVSAHPDHRDAVGRVRGLADLTNPMLKGRIAMGNPVTGTTSGHLAALKVLWGDERYRSWLMGLRENHVRILGGNGPVAEQVGNATFAAGLTDNDDIRAVVDAGGLVTPVLPDQLPGDMGTLLVPTTVAVVAGGPNGEAGQMLAEFLTDRQVEMQLTQMGFLRGSLRMLEAEQVNAMKLDYGKVADALRPATELALTILQDRGGVTTRP
jgi:iron(III) transport system substrate-binding protein